MLNDSVKIYFNFFGEVREWCSQGGLPGEDDANVRHKLLVGGCGEGVIRIQTEV